MAQEGGIGIIHRNLSVDAQAREVEQVKKSESGMIVDPVTIDPGAADRRGARRHAPLPHLRLAGDARGGKLVGILTNRDLRFEKRLDRPGRGGDDAGAAGHGRAGDRRWTRRRRSSTRTASRSCWSSTSASGSKGLITVKDIQKTERSSPMRARTTQGRLRVGAAVGTGVDRDERARSAGARPAST